MTSIGRRQFLAGAGAVAWAARPAFAGLDQAAAATRPGAVFPASVRDDFPTASLETYMNAAARASARPLRRQGDRAKAWPTACTAPARAAPTSTPIARPT